MRPIIEYCTNNLHHGTENILKKLEENPDLDVIEYTCLGNCAECCTNPYVVVNGKIVSADSAEELYDKILIAIEENEDPFAWLDEEPDET